MTTNIQQFFAESPEIPVNSKWDVLWQDSVTPWDKGSASPALVELLIDKHFPLMTPGKTGKALVPGCGKGYDVALFAGLTEEDQKFDKAVGLDISTKAIEEARKLHEGSPGNIEFIVGDFFSTTEEWAQERYDVVYDYTFLCALHPDMRPDWAKRLAELISPGTGHLIALQHPLEPAIFHKEGLYKGPPFLLSPEIYDNLLKDKFERVYFDRPGKNHTVGREDYMSVWRRRDSSQ